MNDVSVVELNGVAHVAAVVVASLFLLSRPRGVIKSIGLVLTRSKAGGTYSTVVGQLLPQVKA